MGPLSTLDAGFKTFLQQLSATKGTRGFSARNFLLDENISAERCQSYHASGSAAAHANGQDWGAAHENYLLQHVFRPGPAAGIPKIIDQDDEDICPETFRILAADSPFVHSAESLHLVRTEELSFISRLSGVSTDKLKTWANDVAQNSSSAASHDALDSALRAWSKNIELRPMFAAYWEDLQDLFGEYPSNDAKGWANQLRDRLGLAHLDPKGRGGTIDVMLFRYPIKSLAQIEALGTDRRALMPPTVLDGTFSQAFCPSPNGEETGYTLDLSGELDTPKREVLHPTLAFTAKHLWRVGTIDAAIDLESMEILRELHLMWLRNKCANSDYALDTDGDLQ